MFGVGRGWRVMSSSMHNIKILNKEVLLLLCK